MLAYKGMALVLVLVLLGPVIMHLLGLVPSGGRSLVRTPSRSSSNLHPGHVIVLPRLQTPLGFLPLGPWILERRKIA